MPSYVPPTRAAEFIFYVELTSQTDTKLFQVNPTLAAGDVKVSTDGAALADLTTLPVVTPASSRNVKVTVSAAEMTGDNVQIYFSDAAGAEWCDLGINIQTTVRKVDDLAWPTTTGRSIDVDASGGVEVGSFQASAITAAAIATGAIDADALATDAVAEIADGVWDEAIAGHLTAGSTGAALNAAGSAGDPWATVVPAAYGAGTAGSRLGRVPDVAAGAAGGLFIAGSNAATSITTALTANVIGNVTGNLSGSVGSVTGDVGGDVVGDVTGSVGSVAAAGMDSIADVVLTRDWTATVIAIGAIPARSLLNAARFLRNKWSIGGSTLTVTTENDTTTAWTGTVTTSTGAPPVRGIDP